MTEDQWASVELHFDEVRSLAPEARAQALEMIGDPSVRTEVASLLEHEGEGETVAAVVGGMAAVIGGTQAHVDHIGPYRLVRRLGQGGQGTVFEAVRDDGNFEQRVAIKIVKWEIDSGEARRRFRDERQILAGLDHPGIARLLDGGETETGSPYLVMEFVDGMPLARAIDGWTPRRKLDLFLQIAAAVAAAHRKLIVHRDLKPANILVTKDGPKLLDFGIAKLVDADSARTVTAFQALTPEYASPEQVRGEPITTACDVYALGIVLYEMLMGKRPYDVPTASPLEIHNAVCLTAPERPNLSPDLDNILLMALRKEPERRYASVEQFAQDIQRSLDHRPVIARPDTLGYRAGRFVRRNALALSAGAAVLVAISAGMFVSLREARIAQQRFEQVRRLAHSFVFDYEDDLARLEGTTAVREKMVRTALDYLDNLSQSASRDIELQKELAAAYQKVGDAQGYPVRPSLGHTAEAIASYRKAAEIHQHIAAQDPAYRAQPTAFYTSFGELYRYIANYDDALKMARLALDSAKQSADQKPDDETAQIRLVQAWYLLGDIAEDSDHNRDAYANNSQADKLARAVLARWRDRKSLQLAQTVRARVGTSARTTGRLKESLAAFDEEEQLLNELLKMEPANPAFHRGIAVLGQFRSYTYDDDATPSLGDPAHCLIYSRQYLEAARAMSAHDPNNASARFSVAVALFRLSYPLKYSDPQGAVAAARESVQKFDAEVARGNHSYLVVSRRARAQRRLAEALMAAHRPAEAQPVIDQVLAAQRAAVAKNSKDLEETTFLALALATAADISDALGDHARSTAQLRDAERVANGVYRTLPGDLSSIIPLAKIRLRLAVRDAFHAGDWTEQARNLWRSYPEQNEYVQGQLAAIKSP